MTLKYATTLQLGNDLRIIKKVPSWDAAATPSNESVGTGDNSETTFYLDQQNIVAGTYTLYYGADATAITTLTETTHYVLTKESGKIVLTSAGVTLLGTNGIFSAYKYFSNGMTDAYIDSVLVRSEKRVDKLTNSTFTDTSGNNPSYPSITEIQSSEGLFQDRIIVEKKPLKDISATLNGAITDSDASIILATGTGSTFPTTGSIIIGSEVITYTGITTDTLTGCTRGTSGSTAAAALDGATVHTTIFYRSNSTEGTAVSWTVQPWDTSMYANAEGLIYKFKDASPDPLTKEGIASRIKITYYYGLDSVPEDITRLVMLIAKQMLIKDTIGNSLIAGRNEFKPGLEDVYQEEIDSIVGSHLVVPMGNT